MAGRLYRMAKVVSANPKSWGIVDANEISGFKRVAKLADLYSIAECILSSSYGDGVTDGVDAVGQIWHVSETNGDYKLTNWASRKSAAGWTKLSYGGDVSVPVRDVHVNDVSVLSNGVAKINLKDYTTKSDVSNTLKNYMTADAVQSAIGNVQESVDSIGNKIGNKTGDGIATLKDGKIPLEQLANLDTVLFEVVTDLPNALNKIKKHIYLKTAGIVGDENVYAEYIYTGGITEHDVYDATKWEKLGEVAAKTDLSEYYKKTEVDSKLTGLARTLTSQDVENFTITPSSRGEQGVGKLYYMQASITRKGGDPLSAIIPCVVSAADTTNANAGLMSPADKQKLDGIAAGANNYTHPTHTAAKKTTEGLYKITVDDLGHVNTTAAVVNADIDKLITVDSTLDIHSSHPVSGNAVNKYINNKKLTTDNLTDNNDGVISDGEYVIPYALINGNGDNKLRYDGNAFVMHCEGNTVDLRINGASLWNSSNLTALTDGELNEILE